MIGASLCARDLEPENNRLTVAPCFLPNSLAGPYWPVILKADNEGRYTAMAVINGQPTVPKSDGCGLPPESEGLFILTRDRIAPPGAPTAFRIYTNPKPIDTVDSIEDCLSLNPAAARRACEGDEG